MLINAGQANAATGDQGYQDSLDSADAVAAALGLERDDVLLESTGQQPSWRESGEQQGWSRCGLWGWGGGGGGAEYSRRHRKGLGDPYGGISSGWSRPSCSHLMLL